MNKDRDIVLDLVRGGAAVCVLLGHLRGFIFVDFDEVQNACLATECFYLVTGFGHQAVMLFFVLSGYLVGGSVFSSVASRQFSWKTYATARLTRLWVVVLPALILTFIVDSVGAVWSPGAYAGEFSLWYGSGPSRTYPAAVDALTFLGNLCFVQTVFVPVYGSNGPLWSLANEFWYYLLFPLVILAGASALERRFTLVSLLYLVLVVVCMSFLPSELILYGGLWLMGALAWLFPWRARCGSLVASSSKSCISSGSPSAHIFCSRFFTVLSLAALVGAIIASRVGNSLGNDFAVGLSFALWLNVSPRRIRFPQLLEWSIAKLSDISFTLYVVHFPVLFFLSAVLFRGQQFQATFEGYSWFVVMTASVFGVSVAMWWLFERNTENVRKFIRTQTTSE